ncbi:hypothetical protein B0O99DRAFT_594635 [Bisporella sp. PMI_857]|nr:hypothetical protein B0O99DRAFT_594635 [Bisporella sp. PMI_857]
MPAILSNPLMAVTVNLVTDEIAASSINQVSDYTTPGDRAQYICIVLSTINKEVTHSPSMFSSIKRPTKNVQSEWGKTHATFSLRCESSEVTIWRDISVIWEPG